MNAGKLVTLLILVVAILAASVAWWHNLQKGRQALEYWGGRSAYLIRQAPIVRLSKLTPPASASPESSDSDALPGGFATGETIDISQVRGLVHARQALISDASFDWNSRQPPSGPWQYGLAFSTATSSETVMVVLDLDRQLAMQDDGAEAIKLNIAEGLKTFFEEQFAAQPATATN